MPVLEGSWLFIVGENKPLAITANRDVVLGSIPAPFAPTATITILLAGVVVVAAAACTVVAGEPALVSYQWAPTIPGVYEVIFAVTDSGNTIEFIGSVTVQAK